MDKIKLCAIVIWYNPSLNDVEKIKTYATYFSRLYIVDNSTTNNEYLLSELPSYTYIPNYENYGIAKAQNIACQKALDENYEWALMMDQDSSWKPDQLEKYFSLIEEYEKKGYRSFGTRTASTLKIKSDVEDMDILMASGNFFSLKDWQIVGGFREEFFIDEVDHDFSLKLQTKFGNCLVRFNTVFMEHKLGTPKKTLFKRLDFHKGKRLYYMTRNMLYLTKEHPAYNKRWSRRYAVGILFLQNIRDFQFKEVYYMIKGFIDYKKGKLGKI